MDYDEKMNEGRAYMAASVRRIREVYTYNTSQGFVMYALCEDGTLWSRSPFAEDGNTGWDAVPPIPGSFQALKEATEAFKTVADELLKECPELRVDTVAVKTYFDEVRWPVCPRCNWPLSLHLDGTCPQSTYEHPEIKG